MTHFCITQNHLACMIGWWELAKGSGSTIEYSGAGSADGTRYAIQSDVGK